MSEQYMPQMATEFLQAMDVAGKKLHNFSQEIENRNQAVFSALETFEQTCMALLKESLPQQKSTSVDEALMGIKASLEQSIASWHASITKSKSGQKFMDEHDKYMVVMVFGAVKAGKSTLGNFLAGREWLKTSFDNEYKQRDPAQFMQEEEGRKEGGIEKQDGRDWFCEGYTDTTGNIQYFTLSGLRWFDSPGTGALAKEHDKVNMEDMVKQYLPFVDMCIFLINSSEPGLMEDMKYMKFLSRAEQEALVVITRSDMIEEDVDEEGDLVQLCVPKKAAQRQLQEEDMCRRLQAAYPDLDSEKYRAMSLSTRLAKEALQENDEAKFRASQLDILMQKLTAKARGNVVKMKEKRPKKVMNQFIQEIMDGDETISGLSGFRDKLQKIQESVDDFRQKIDERTEKLTQKIQHRVETAVTEKISQMAHQLEKKSNSKDTAIERAQDEAWEQFRHFGGKHDEQTITRDKAVTSGVDAGTIANVLSTMTQSILAEEVNHAISLIIGKNREQADNLSMEMAEPQLALQGLQKVQKEVKHTYPEVIVVERDPDGMWEQFRHFFGKHYKQTITRNKVVTSMVDAGTNVDAVIEELMPQVERYVWDTVHSNLQKIADSYFAPQERLLTAMQVQMEHLQKTLTGLKF